MCGIFGLVQSPWREQAEGALGALGSRGPDARHIWADDHVVLGHTRLAVIDLVTGEQPMRSPDGRLVVVFNGEIYNYRELRRELERQGYRFVTQSDTEVLLHGYAEWGRALLSRLDGMFAFAVWDRHRRKLFAARDRLGIKPFVYSQYRGFAFASTIAPFLSLDGFPRRIDYEALRDYLAAQTPFAPHTFLRDVRQLPPAHFLEYDVENGGTVVESYWRIPGPSAASTDHEELVERVDQALRASVRRQLVADVPLGAFLSGGIDSSLMVHYMAQAGVEPLKTFSVRFSQARFDESAYASEVAARYGAEHHVFDAPDIDGETFTSSIRSLDQPLADPAYVPTYALARLTRQHVTVAISGDGGDELFGGYERFFDEESKYPRRWWQPALRHAVESGWLPESLLRRTLWGRDLLFYRRVELGPYPVSRKSMARYLLPPAREAARIEATLERWRSLIAEYGDRYDASALMRADLWTYLSENCLVKTDRASMAWGLEVRVPMLGNEVLDAVLELPASAHYDGQGKRLLRALAMRHLPRSVWDRPKHGFSVPLTDYFAGPWRERCEDWLSRTEALAPYLDAEAVRAAWRAALDGRGSARLAYTFIVLLAWLEAHPLSG